MQRNSWNTRRVTSTGTYATSANAEATETPGPCGTAQIHREGTMGPHVYGTGAQIASGNSKYVPLQTLSLKRGRRVKGRGQKWPDPGKKALFPKKSIIFNRMKRSNPPSTSYVLSRLLKRQRRMSVFLFFSGSNRNFFRLENFPKLNVD